MPFASDCTRMFVHTDADVSIGTFDCPASPSRARKRQRRATVGGLRLKVATLREELELEKDKNKVLKARVERLRTERDTAKVTMPPPRLALRRAIKAILREVRCHARPHQ